MRGDYSRLTFNPRKHYTGVLRQQGRVDSDADWNEQVDIRRHYLRLLALDLIGPCGGPIGAAGFKIVAARAGRELRIGAGRYYVGGLLAENEEDCPFEAQPDLSESQRDWLTGPPQAGAYRAHLQVWEREVSHLDDPTLVDPALGGSAVRLQVAWQVRVCPVTDVRGCCVETDRGGKTWGSLSVPSSEYVGLEHRLYRIEIHRGGRLGSATFKWSRTNARDAYAITAAQGAVLTIAGTAADSWRPLRVGQWVEVIDKAQEADALPGHLYSVEEVDELAGSVTLATGGKHAAPAAVIDLTRRPMLRAWDHRDGDERGQATNTGEIDLEDGIIVRFGAGAYRSGDYWLVPARSDDESISSAGQVSMTAQPASWIPRYCCPLADVESDSRGRWQVHNDLRSVFSPVGLAT